MALKEKVLALDVGEARIGLALGELGSSFAFGRGYLTRKSLEADILALKNLLTKENASYFVIGLPRRTDGADSAQTERVRAFAAALEAAGLSYDFEDERFTTRMAGQNILKSGKKKKQRQEKGLLDEASAILILESYLSRKKQAKLDTP